MPSQSFLLFGQRRVKVDVANSGMLSRASAGLQERKVVFGMLSALADALHWVEAIEHRARIEHSMPRVTRSFMIE